MNLLRAEKPIYLKGPYIALPEKIMSNQEVLDWMNSSQNPAVIGFSTPRSNKNVWRTLCGT